MLTGWIGSIVTCAYIAVGNEIFLMSTYVWKIGYCAECDIFRIKKIEQNSKAFCITDEKLHCTMQYQPTNKKKKKFHKTYCSRTTAIERFFRTVNVWLSTSVCRLQSVDLVNLRCGFELIMYIWGCRVCARVSLLVDQNDVENSLTLINCAEFENTLLLGISNIRLMNIWSV